LALAQVAGLEPVLLVERVAAPGLAGQPARDAELVQGPVEQLARGAGPVQGLVEQLARDAEQGQVALPVPDAPLVQGQVEPPAQVEQLGWGVPPVPDAPLVRDEEPGQVLQLVPGVPPGWARVWLAVQVLPVRPPDERARFGEPPVVQAVAALPLGEARQRAG
jgi:hypothetical protein